MFHRSRSAMRLFRLFSTQAPTLSMAAIKEASTRRMLEQYPHLLLREFKGEIVYTLRRESPEEVKKAGGLLARDQVIWLSNTDSGHNQGSICFTLLPEVTSLFAKSPKPFIYAFPLHGLFPVPGGRWRQVLSPGAFPLTSAWRARQFLGWDGWDGKNELQLGPLQGEGQLVDSFSCPRFKDYMNEKQHRLKMPKALSTADDCESVFDIIDTPLSKKFQKAVEAHYENYAKNNLTPKPRSPK